MVAAAEEEVSKRKDFRMRLKWKSEADGGGSGSSPQQPFLSRFFGSRRSGRRKKEEDDHPAKGNDGLDPDGCILADWNGRHSFDQ